MEETLLEELLMQWEDSRSRGNTITVEELCKANPELIQELRHRIGALESLDAFLHEQVETSRSHSFDDRMIGSERSGVIREYGSIATQSRYENLRPHARGGLGEIFIASDRDLQRDVAIKVIQSPYDHDQNRRLRFVREAEITSRLEHPGVVPVHGVGKDTAGRPCYSMRFIEGENLQVAIQRLHEEGRSLSTRNLELRKLLQRFITVCNTIAFAHSRSILHRDLKPNNIMLGKFGETLVVDWGLAKQLKSTQGSPDTDIDIDDHAEAMREVAEGSNSIAQDGPLSLTIEKRIMGTPSFMSPEQARGDKDLTFSTDIFGLGATLYVVITGKALYQGSSYAELIERARSCQFKKPRDLSHDLPLALEAICLKAISFRPADRYSNALEMAQDIEHWMLDEPTIARKESWLEITSRFARKHRAWTQAAVISLGLLTIVSTLFALGLAHQTQIANEHRAAAEMLASEKSNLAEHEKLARELAEKLASEKGRLVASEMTARKNADEQAKLSLSTLKLVVETLQKKLSNVDGATNVRRELLTTAIEGLKKISKSLSTREDADYYLSQAHSDIGLLLLNVGNDADGNPTLLAKEHLERAIAIIGELAKKSSDTSVLRQLSMSYEHLGDTFMQTGDWDRAQEIYQKSLDVSIGIAAREPDSKNADRDIAFGFEKLGDVHYQRQSISDAKEAYLLTKYHLQQAKQKHPEYNVLNRDLLVNQSKLGNIHTSEGDLALAASMFEESLSLIDILEKQGGVQARDRVVQLNKLGNIRELQGQLDVALGIFQTGLDIARTIVKNNPTSIQASRDLTISLVHVATIRVAQDQLTIARQLLQETLELRTRLAKEDPTSYSLQIELASVLASFAQLERKADKLQTCRGYLEAAWEILKPLEEGGKLVSAEDKVLLETVAKEVHAVPNE